MMLLARRSNPEIPSVTIIVLLLITLFGWHRDLIASPQQRDTQDVSPNIGVRVPSGFRIVQAAGPELADDIYAMTVSDKGEVYVSGRGYLKRLNDADSDGVFETATLFSNLPANGAQGLLVQDGWFLVTGDEGVLSFRDENHDGLSDGDPVCLLKTKTGVEHGSHALRIGPEGMLYLLAGNATPISKDFYSDPGSPIKDPQAGFLMRMNLDGTNKQIIADGFRNAYDFDFNDAGEIFVYDSDGERDISLPWYRPTRVYQIRPGDSGGWLSVGWKRSSDYLDMPRTIAALGRGSPTGVETMRRRSVDKNNRGATSAFPEKFRQAVFVGDWTFGRVIALRPGPSGYERVDFAIAEDQFGFAVTDLAFCPDGSLLVSVGGRGTRGAIYRITYNENGNGNAGAESADVAMNEANSLRSNSQSGENLLAALKSPSKLVREAALSQCLVHPDVVKDVAISSHLVRQLVSFFDSEDLAMVGLAFRVAQTLPKKVVTEAIEDRWSDEAKLLLRLAVAEDEASRRSVLMAALEILPRSQRSKLVIRAAQLSMGGCTRKASDEMFAGYEPQLPVTLDPDQVARVNRAIEETIANRLAYLRTLKSDAVDEASDLEWELQETGRLAAMLGPQLSIAQPSNPLAKLLRQIILDQRNIVGNRSTSIECTIHWLAVSARVTTAKGRSNELVDAIVQAIFVIRAKRNATNQSIDRNFYPRLTSLVKRLIADDPTMQQVIAKQFDGSEESLFCYDAMPVESRKKMNRSIANFVRTRPDEVTYRQLQILAKSEDLNHQNLVRSFQSRPEFQSAVLLGMSQNPIAKDFSFYLKSLESREAGVLKSAAIGLRRLVESNQTSGSSESDMVTRALVAARAIGWARAQVSARDQLILLLRAATKQEFGYAMRRYELRGADLSLQQESLDRWFEYGKVTYGARFIELTKPQANPAVAELMKRLRFELGDAKRGRAIYQKARCAQCHDAGNRLGPRLDGITKRFSREDLLRSIIDPSENIPDRYQAIAIATLDGNVIQGTVVYDSVAGVVIQTADGMTATIRQEDIEQRQLSDQSLMPAALMENASDQDWVDLVKFLESK